MKVRIRKTNAVVDEYEFRALYPNTSFPLVLSEELLNDFGADPVFEGPQPTLTADQYAQADGVELINGQWFTKYIAVDYTAEEIAARVDQWRQSAVVTPFQGRMALADAELLSNVEAAVAAADEKTRVAWEYALEWRRTSPLIATLATALSLTDEQVDTLFKEASSVEA